MSWYFSGASVLSGQPNMYSLFYNRSCYYVIWLDILLGMTATSKMDHSPSSLSKRFANFIFETKSSIFDVQVCRHKELKTSLVRIIQVGRAYCVPRPIRMEPLTCQHLIPTLMFAYLLLPSCLPSHLSQRLFPPDLFIRQLSLGLHRWIYFYKTSFYALEEL